MQVVNDQFSDMKVSANAKRDASRAAICIEPAAGSDFDVAGKVFPVILSNVTHPNISITLSDNHDYVSINGNRHDADHLKATVGRIIHSNLDTMKNVLLPVRVLVYSDQCIRLRFEKDQSNVIF